MDEAMARKRLLGPVKKPRLSKKWKNESPTDDAEHSVRKRSGGAEHEDIRGESGGVFAKLIPCNTVIPTRQGRARHKFRLLSI